MAIIYEPCVCELPSAAGHADGTLWECDNCLALYRLDLDNATYWPGSRVLAKWVKLADSPLGREAERHAAFRRMQARLKTTRGEGSK